MLGLRWRRIRQRLLERRAGALDTVRRLLFVLLGWLLVGQLRRTRGGPRALPRAIEECADLRALRVSALRHEGRQRRV